MLGIETNPTPNTIIPAASLQRPGDLTLCIFLGVTRERGETPAHTLTVVRPLALRHTYVLLREPESLMYLGH